MGLTFPPSGCNESTSGGGGGSGSNVTSVAYNPGTEILTITTDQPAVFNTSIPASSGIASVLALLPNARIDNTDPLNPVVEVGQASWIFASTLTPTLTPFVTIDNLVSTDAAIIKLNAEYTDIAGIAGGVDGRILILENISIGEMYIGNQIGTSLAANQFQIAGLAAGDYYYFDVNEVLVLVYDGYIQKWKLSNKPIITDNTTVFGAGTVGNPLSAAFSGGTMTDLTGTNSVATTPSTITGSGTVELVNDLASPPANYNYGTDGAGVKGWKPDGSAISINKTLYVDEVYGNDGTAIPDSLSLKYATIDAALADWTTDDLIYLLPGNYPMSVRYTISEDLRIYMELGSHFQPATSGSAFLIGQDQSLFIDGYGDLELTSSLASALVPNGTKLCYADVKCRTIAAGGGIIFSGATMEFSIETDSIDRGYISTIGYGNGSIACDDWYTRNYIVQLTSFSSNSGEENYVLHGPQYFTIKGRSKPKCFIHNDSQCSNAIYLQAGATTEKTRVYIYADFDSNNGFFFNQGRGIVQWHGNLIHRKDDLGGNEVPWYYSTQVISGDEVKVCFRHMEGVCVSGTHPDFAGSQNNELFSINTVGIFEFYGKYENWGKNTGLGAWPILLFNNSTGTGNSRIILGGEFKNSDEGVAPVKIIDAGNINHNFELQCRNATIDTKHATCIDANLPVKFYVYYAFCSNVALNVLVNSALLPDRVMIDEQINLIIPEYGV